MQNYINYLPIYSRHAIFNLIEAPRDVGKTFTAKLWGTKRFLKCGKKFVWVRRTEEETKVAKGKFFKKKHLKMLGISPEDVRIKGNYGYIKRGRKWVDFVEFCSLATAEKQRSVDDEDYDFMFVDEAFATPAKRAVYKGDEVRDFIDLFISKKREHKMTAFLIGNKETINNPYFQYFGITPPPDGFEGVRMFRNGTVCVWTFSDFVESEDHDQMTALLQGTPYYEYMFKGAAKCATPVRLEKTPKNARFYCAFDFGTPVTISRHNGRFFARGGLDPSRNVFVSRETMGKYAVQILCTRRDKTRFAGVERAYKSNSISYDTNLTAETVLSIFEQIGIAK